MDFHFHKLCVLFAQNFFRNFRILEMNADLQEQLIKLSELVPIVIIGFFMGFASIFAEPESDRTKKPKISSKKITHNIISSIVLCVSVYSVLGVFDSVNYLVRVGCACAVSFFGIEKVLDIFANFVRAKDGKDRDFRR